MSDQQPTAPASIKPYSLPVVIAFVYAGLVLPVICFVMSLNGSPDAADWQSGALHDYASFLLSGETAFVFYPFLAFAMTCFACALFAPRRFCQSVVVRFGLYTGVVLAAHFSVVLGIVLLDVDAWFSSRWLAVAAFAAVVIAVPWVAWLVVRLVWRLVQPSVMRVLRMAWSRLRSINISARLLVRMAAGFVVLSAIILELFWFFEWPWRALEFPTSVLGVSLFLSLCCAPFWTLAVYCAMSVRVIRLSRIALRVSLWRFLVVFTWLGAYLAAWRAAVSRTVELYAQLPTEPSNCYIATAAANGHSGFVRSRSLRMADGRRFRVNQQLACFKCGELALMSVAPRLHRRLRKIYDQYGPILARQLVRPLAADVAYASLKPCEWATRVLLVVLLPNAGQVSRALYQSEQQECPPRSRFIEQELT